MKKCLIIALLTLSFFNAKPQGWLDKLKDKVDRTVNQVEQSDIVKTIDPKDWLMNKINSMLRVSNPFNGLRNEINRLSSKAFKDFNLISPADVNVTSYFAQLPKDQYLDVISPILTGSTAKKMVGQISVNGVNYVPLLIDEALVLYSPENKSLPVGEDYKNGLKAVILKINSVKLNSEFANNLSNVSGIIYQISSTAADFSELTIDKMSPVEQLEYMGVSAISILDPILSSSVGISYGDVKSSLSSFRDASVALRNSSSNLKQASTTILSALTKIRNMPSLDVQTVLELDAAIETIAKEINSLNTNVSELKNTLNNSASGLIRLSDFSEIKFFQVVGNSIQDLSNSVGELESFLSNYAGRMSEFNSQNAAFVNTEWEKGKGFLFSKVNQEYKQYLTVEKSFVQELGQLTKELELTDLNSGKNFDKWLTELMELDKSFSHAMNSDIVQGINYAAQLKQKIESLNKNDLNSFILDVNEKVKGVQVIFSPDDELVIKTLRNVKDNSKYEDIKVLKSSLINMKDSAKTANMVFFSVVILMVAGSGTTFYLKNRKK
jgi:hypothetical protein